VAAKQTKKEKEEEQKLRRLGRLLKERGIQIRREILSRGPAFRVKSGTCTVEGEGVIFVDKRLPVPQQTNLLLDFLMERQVGLTDEELTLIPEASRSLFVNSTTAENL